jgi:hypothetical protein
LITNKLIEMKLTTKISVSLIILDVLFLIVLWIVHVWTDEHMFELINNLAKTGGIIMIMLFVILIADLIMQGEIGV